MTPEDWAREAAAELGLDEQEEEYIAGLFGQAMQQVLDEERG
jgi:hypothetical protein